MHWIKLRLLFLSYWIRFDFYDKTEIFLIDDSFLNDYLLCLENLLVRQVVILFTGYVM